jgi:hypothetical protein
MYPTTGVELNFFMKRIIRENSSKNDYYFISPKSWDLYDLMEGDHRFYEAGFNVKLGDLIQFIEDYKIDIDDKDYEMFVYEIDDETMVGDRIYDLHSLIYDSDD